MYTKYWCILFQYSTSKLLRVGSKASRTITTNTSRSTDSMTASQPISPTTYSRHSARFTLVNPSESPHTTLVRLMCTSSRVCNVCESMVYLIELITMHRWTPRGGSCTPRRDYQAHRWRCTPRRGRHAQHIYYSEQMQMQVEKYDLSVW